MIAKLKGIVDYKGDDFLIIDTGAIGYQVFVSQTTKFTAIEDQGVILYTLEVMRKEQICLIGFLTLEERWLFEKLIEVQGVGVKVALGIMSTMSANELAYALIHKEKKKFKDVDGIGDKLADRIILELKGKIDPTLAMTVDKATSSLTDDVVAVLISLGYSRPDAMSFAKDVIKEYPDLTNTTDIIKHILKKRASF